jgi:hypothetical protein
MSRQIYNNMNTNNNSNKRTPKCITCEKAGITGTALEHYTRQTPDPNSPIVCPTILAFKCGYCGQVGHSKGFCQVFKADQARAEREQARQEQEEERRRNARRAEEERQRQETTRRLQSNIFTAFDDEEENELAEELKAQLAEQAMIQAHEMAFPSLSSKPSKQQSQQTIQFALVAKNAAHLPVPKPKPKVVVEETVDYEDSDYDDDDYTPYVPDDSFENDDIYGRPVYARQYYTEEHELAEQTINIDNNKSISDINMDYPVSRSVVPDDDSW